MLPIIFKWKEQWIQSVMHLLKTLVATQGMWRKNSWIILRSVQRFFFFFLLAPTMLSTCFWMPCSLSFFVFLFCVDFIHWYRNKCSSLKKIWMVIRVLDFQINCWQNKRKSSKPTWCKGKNLTSSVIFHLISKNIHIINNLNIFFNIYIFSSFFNYFLVGLIERGGKRPSS